MEKFKVQHESERTLYRPGHQSWRSLPLVIEQQNPKWRVIDRQWQSILNGQWNSVGECRYYVAYNSKLTYGPAVFRVPASSLSCGPAQQLHLRPAGGSHNSIVKERRNLSGRASALFHPSSPSFFVVVVVVVVATCAATTYTRTIAITNKSCHIPFFLSFFLSFLSSPKKKKMTMTYTDDDPPVQI